MCALAFACVCARAQYYQVRNFSTFDYRAGTQNWCIAEGPNHRIFYGNNQGLLVFDGEIWSTKYIDNYSAIRALYYDRETERLYAGASDELGYYQADENSCQVGYHSLKALLPKDKRTTGEVWNILKQGRNIVFQSKTCLMVYDEQQQRIAVHQNGQRIECAARIGNRIITAGPKGASVLEPDGLKPLSGTEPLRGKTIRAILEYGRLTLFLTNNDGVMAYDGRQTTHLDLPVTPYLKDNQVFSADIDGDNIAFGTIRGGLVLYNLKTQQTHYSNTATWLQNNTVLATKFDTNHNLWLGLDNGISYVVCDSPVNSLFHSNSHIGTGYAAKVSGQRLYVGTNQGLFVTGWPIKSSPTPPLPQLIPGMTGQIWSLCDIEGTLLCGSDNGAYVISGLTAGRIGGTEGTWNFAALPHHPGLALGCDYRGFFVLERQGASYRLRNRIENAGLKSGNFYVDDDGTLWVGHWQEGIYHLWLDEALQKVVKKEYFHKGNGLLMNESNVLCRIDGRICISCVDGFYCYDKKKHQLVHDPKLSHIFNTYGTPLNIFQTPRGDLWAFKKNFLALATRRQDGTYHPDSLSFQYSSHELHVGTGDMCYLDDHHTLVNGNSGFFILDSNYRYKRQTVNTYIRKVVGTNDTDTLLYLSLTNTKAAPLVRVPHSLNSLRIEFIQPEFRDDRAVSYQCKLEGYDRNWSQPQRSTSKEYTQLHKGTYTFHVRAINRLNGHTDETSIRIEILPAWYETWWAYTVYLLLAALAAWYLLRLLKRRQERALAKERKEQERQLKEQQAQFSLEQAEKENELMRLKAEQLEYEMKQGASKLADSTMNLMRKNDMLTTLDTQMEELSESVRREDAKSSITKKIKDIRHDIQANIKDDENWEKFEENFNLVYDNYMRKLTSRFPDLKLNERKLCAYLRMGLSSKEMASLLNTNVRSIETARYRLRKKLQMESGENLKDFIQNIDK